MSLSASARSSPHRQRGHRVRLAERIRHDGRVGRVSDPAGRVDRRRGV